MWNRLLPVLAATALIAAAQNDAPGRVGRLNYISGAVSFEPAGVDEWVEANPNRPLTTGDRLWTDERSRAEVHIGSTAVRLNARTAFEFLNLDDENAQIRLTEGSLSVRVLRLDENETFEVDTPNLAFSILRTGEYRIDVNPDTNETWVTVRGGQGDVRGGGQPFLVRPREQARVWGSDPVNYDVGAAPAPDEWDDWCRARDQREERAESARYVSRDVVGYQDLDDYGSWRTDGEYGPLWYPRQVATGWAPYRYGHWAWIEPWGWTWVDDAPWGFAPFHYGRWVYVGGGWGWAPGPVRVRPVYAPALVAWVGGPRFGLSISFGGGGGIGWFPLGPHEVYRPAYRASPAYITRVNNSNTVINNINITNVYNENTRYLNQNAPGAVTAVPRGAMENARAIQQVAVPVRGQALESGQILNTAPVAPTRTSVLGRAGSPGGRAVQPPASAMNRAVVANTAPPPAPVPFARREAELSRNPGRPLDAGQVQQLRGGQPALAPLVRPVPGGFGRGAAGGQRVDSAPPPARNPEAAPRSGGFGRQNQDAPPLAPRGGFGRQDAPAGPNQQQIDQQQRRNQELEQQRLNQERQQQQQRVFQEQQQQREQQQRPQQPPAGPNQQQIDQQQRRNQELEQQRLNQERQQQQQRTFQEQQLQREQQQRPQQPPAGPNQQQIDQQQRRNQELEQQRLNQERQQQQQRTFQEQQQQREQQQRDQRQREQQARPQAPPPPEQPRVYQEPQRRQAPPDGGRQATPEGRQGREKEKPADKQEEKKPVKPDK